MQQFFIVAVLYGFAMLLPASNHAKILRTAMGAGGHAAMAASFGIAIGTGISCATAFVAAGMLGNRGLWTLAMECAGCLLLLRLAGMCLRDAGLTSLSPLSLQMPRGLKARSRWPHAEAGCLLALASINTGRCSSRLQPWSAASLPTWIQRPLTWPAWAASRCRSAC